MVGDRGPSVVCVGANIESEVALKHLLAHDVPVSALVTLPSRSFRGVSDYRDLHDLCNKLGVATIDTEDINAPETREAIARLKPDYIFVLGWSQIIKQAFLSCPSGFVVGSHPTPLPQRRGRAPVPWTLIEGHSVSAVTLFRMRPGIDDGPILVQRRFKVPKDAYAMELYTVVTRELSTGFLELYKALRDGTWTEKEQPGEEATYRAKRTPADGCLDFNRPAHELVTLVRAVSEPFPGAYTYYEGEKVNVWRACRYTGPERRGVIGQVLSRNDGVLVVQARDAPVCLYEMTCSGEPLPAGDIRVGAVFGFRVEDTLFELQQRVVKLETWLGGGDD